MAKYVIGVRNVRSVNNPSPSGTKDKPVGGARYAIFNDSAAPDASECLALANSLFGDGNAVPTAVGTALAAGIANATARASETTGAISFRHGKGIYQVGVGYHASSDASAIASVNWKNL
jgi:hypothetical protein